MFTDGSSVLSREPASAGWVQCGPAVCRQGDIGYRGRVIPSSDAWEVLALVWSLAFARRLPSYVAVETLVR